MSSTHLFATWLLACSVLAARPVAAQTATGAPPSESAQQGGLALRLRVGPAYLSTTEAFNELRDRNHSGAGFAFDAEIGGWLTSNVTLCAQVSGAVAFDASADDAATVYSGGLAAADLSTAGIGPSITYVRSDGIYVGASPAFTIMRTSATDHFFLAKDWGSNYFGVGIGFDVGREWRVSDRWRLGAAAQAKYAALPSNGSVSTMSEYALSFSATHD
jgi:hypothetical protein